MRRWVAILAVCFALSGCLQVAITGLQVAGPRPQRSNKAAIVVVASILVLVVGAVVVHELRKDDGFSCSGGGYSERVMCGY